MRALLLLAACAQAPATAPPAPAAAAPPPPAPAATGPAPARPAVTGPPPSACAASLALPNALVRAAGEPAAWVGAPQVDLRGVEGLNADTLFTALRQPPARSVEALVLSGVPLGSAGKALGAAELPALRALWVDDTGLGETGLRGLFYSEGLPSLQVLDASGAGLDADALQALSGSALLRTLKSLDLRGSAVGGAAILTALSPADAPELRCVFVDGMVPDAAVAAWARRGVTVVTDAPR